MKWVGLMNDIKACAEEIVLREGIYVSRKGDRKAALYKDENKNC